MNGSNPPISTIRPTSRYERWLLVCQVVFVCIAVICANDRRTSTSSKMKYGVFKKGTKNVLSETLVFQHLRSRISTFKKDFFSEQLEHKLATTAPSPIRTKFPITLVPKVRPSRKELRKLVDRMTKFNSNCSVPTLFSIRVRAPINIGRFGDGNV